MDAMLGIHACGFEAGSHCLVNLSKITSTSNDAYVINLATNKNLDSDAYDCFNTRTALLSFAAIQYRFSLRIQDQLSLIIVEEVDRG